MTTPYHAQYFAHEITRQGGSGIDRLSQSLFDACVDLNPHQIEAALFAVRSPLSKGVLLADEVGLGKTIEAGLAICQSWAERKRRILIIVPASLRKQWAIELEEKFNLPSFILDAKTYRQVKKGGNPTPFHDSKIVITSLHFASRRADEIRVVPWDMVVIDEAHKLRNAYRQSNTMGQNIKWATEGKRKILLTATPLQNSLLELYGLASIIDDRLFGDLPSFRTQYVNAGADLAGLRDRLRSFCKRTLRSQVQEFIQYTERKLITRPFTPTEQEHKLYEMVSAYLQRDNTYAFPEQQRHLTTLIVRKLLASSSQALAGTLEVMRERLKTLRDEHHAEMDLATRIIEDEEIEDEWLDEYLEDSRETGEGERDEAAEPRAIDMAALNAEIAELEDYIRWARSIGIDTKARALLKALSIGFEHMAAMGARQKAVVFTESRRTQQYIRDFLEANGHAGRIVTFNGTNNEPDSTAIYTRWCETNRDSGRLSGSRQIDIRTALLEHFEADADILIATEAAGEGVNLQFCSLVVNFDLPWNPQRIEQRIGRCHRYGQKHDVVVINFLNERNAADQRVYELLQDKFRLFSGIFGASDEVLGAIESGVDFERRVLDIYQECRSTEEIEAAFQKLREELDESIAARMQQVQEILLEHFDEDVHERLRVNLSGARDRLDRIGRMFWTLTHFILNSHALFDDEQLLFSLHNPPGPQFQPGTYHLISKEKRNIPGEFLYRLSHPLGEHVIDGGKAVDTPAAHVRFNESGHATKVSLVRGLRGKAGWLLLQRLVVDSFEREEYLLFSGFAEDGTTLDQETCEKLFVCAGTVDGGDTPGPDHAQRLNAEAERHRRATLNRSLEANNRHFLEARDQLERWADDMVLAAERELQDTKEQLKALNRQARQAPTMDEQREMQEKIQAMEKKKRQLRQRIFDVEDEIIDKRDRLINELEQRMQQKTENEVLFTIRWSVV